MKKRRKRLIVITQSCDNPRPSPGATTQSHLRTRMSRILSRRRLCIRIGEPFEMDEFDIKYLTLKVFLAKRELLHIQHISTYGYFYYR